jgi:hypothetical protein
MVTRHDASRPSLRRRGRLPFEVTLRRAGALVARRLNECDRDESRPGLRLSARRCLRRVECLGICRLPLGATRDARRAGPIAKAQHPAGHRFTGRDRARSRLDRDSLLEVRGHGRGGRWQHLAARAPDPGRIRRIHRGPRFELVVGKPSSGGVAALGSLGGDVPGERGLCGVAPVPTHPARPIEVAEQGADPPADRVHGGLYLETRHAMPNELVGAADMGGNHGLTRSPSFQGNDTEQLVAARHAHRTTRFEQIDALLAFEM